MSQSHLDILKGTYMYENCGVDVCASLSDQPDQPDNLVRSDRSSPVPCTAATHWRSTILYSLILIRRFHHTNNKSNSTEVHISQI